MSLPLPSAPADNRFRLVLVEQDEAAARLILGFLGRTGFDCRHAGDAEIAIGAWNETQPHLMLITASALLDGAALCRWVRERSAVPILMLGVADESAEVAAFKLGADDYLPLPLRPAILMARVVAALRRAYRYNAPAPKADNPFGLPVETSEDQSTLPSGWAQCDSCGYAGPRFKFEKEDLKGDIKMTCPNCKSTDHVVFSLN